MITAIAITVLVIFLGFVLTGIITDSDWMLIVAVYVAAVIAGGAVIAALWIAWSYALTTGGLW